MNTESDAAHPEPEYEEDANSADQDDSPSQAGPELKGDPSEEVTCPRCDRKLPPDSPQQLCPYCLLAAETCDLDAWSQPSQRWSNFEPPEPSQLQPFFESLEIAGLIGRGGMGAVYRAHQHSLGRDVALKILPPEVAATEGFTDRFLREARALARLGHPNVVMVYDHGTAGPYAYLVMELVEGINLRELMAGERLPVEEALRIVPQLCDALQFAHAKGVVHRDIKPENILIEENGTVKITDFGLAKLGEGEDPVGRTGTRQVMGTMHYMAPEQIERPREVDHRADLYSLGVVFYELLTGELPLGRFSPPSEKAGTSRGVDHVVLKSLEKEPNRRYSSAEEVRSDLDRSGPEIGQRARAAAHAVDQKVRHATGAVVGAASQLNDSGMSVALTMLLYGLAGFALLVMFNTRNPGPWTLFWPPVLWGSAYLLGRRYRAHPLPDKLALIGVPINWLGQLPGKFYDLLVGGARSIEGLRAPWMIAGVTAFLISIVCLGFGATVAEEFVPAGLLVAPIAWWLTRMALPTEMKPMTLPAKLLTYPPIVMTLIPLTLLFLAWPAIAWIICIASMPGDWFSGPTGIDVDFEQATRTGNVAMIKSQIFGGLSIEMLWLSLLALLGAVFPEHVKWLARPLLDEWTGRRRWTILMICGVALVIAWILWSI